MFNNCNCSIRRHLSLLFISFKRWREQDLVEGIEDNKLLRVFDDLKSTVKFRLSLFSGKSVCLFELNEFERPILEINEFFLN